MLYSAPAFVELVKASIPEQAFQAILTGEQKRKIATGALELMTKKDGSLLANLINPKTKKVVSTIALEKVSNIPNLSDASPNSLNDSLEGLNDSFFINDKNPRE